MLAAALLPLGATSPLGAQSGGGGGKGFVVQNIPVDVTAKTAQAARAEGWRAAQRQAWPVLWSRLTGGDQAAAPRLGDSALDAIVAGIEIERERVSPTRYIATVGVVFDRVRASRYLGDAQVARSKPMLVLPTLLDAGVRTAYEVRTPWVAAWSAYRDAVTPLDYVMADAGPADRILLSGWQARRTDREMWRNALARYQAADILVPELLLERSYAGGPVSALLIARHGPDGAEIGRVRLVNRGGGIDALMAEAVRQADALYAEALRAGRLRTEAALTAELAPIASAAPQIGGTPIITDGIVATVATPDAATWSAIEATLRGTSGVIGVTLDSLSLGGISQITIGYSSSYDMLRYELDQRGLRLEEGQGGLVLRRKQPGDAPIPRPVEPDPAAGTTVIEETESTAAIPPVPARPAAAPRQPTPRTLPTPPPANEGGPVDLLPPPR